MLAGLSWLASLGPPERVGAMPTVYGIWCPWGDKCSKRGKLLAKHTDEETVRSMLLNHLQSSPYHHDESDEAMVAAAAEAEVSSWETEEQEQEQEQEETPAETPDEGEDDAEEPMAKKTKWWSKGKDKKGKGKGYKAKGKQPTQPTQQPSVQDFATYVVEAIGKQQEMLPEQQQ